MGDSVRWSLVGGIVSVLLSAGIGWSRERVDLQERFGIVNGEIVSTLPLVEFYNHPTKRWEELLGNYVLVYEIKAIMAYEKRLRSMVSEFSEYYRLYRDRGLVVLAVSSEPEKRLLDLAARLGVEHPIARFHAKGQRDMNRVFGLGGPARGALIDPYGVLLMRSPTAAVLAEVMDADFLGMRPVAAAFPIWSWPKAARRTADLLRKRSFRPALKAASAFAEEAPKVQDVVRNLLKEKERSIREAYRNGNYRWCWEQAEDVISEARGTWVAEKAKALKKEILKDGERLKRYRTQCELWSLIVDYQRFGMGVYHETRWKFPEAREQMEKVEELCKRCPGSFAAREARSFLERLEARYEGLCDECGRPLELCAHLCMKPTGCGGSTPKGTGTGTTPGKNGEKGGTTPTPKRPK